MTLLTQSWEHRLIDLAYEALHSHEAPRPRVSARAAELQAAYAHCAALTAHHSKRKKTGKSIKAFIIGSHL